MRYALLVVSLGAALLACGSETVPGNAGSRSEVSEGAALSSDLSTASSESRSSEQSSTVSSDDRVDASTAVESSTLERGAESMDAQIPIVPIAGQQRDDPAPYFGRQNPAGGVTEPTPGFAPAAVDEEFCWAVSVINSRPQPRDDFEEVVVGVQYFSHIERYVPPELADAFAEVVEFANSIVEAGSFEDADEPSEGDVLSTALQTINDFVDRRCLGLA